MSKDKGVKNIKKAPADKSLGNKKISDYKQESKSSSSQTITPKASEKKDKGAKP